MNSKERVFARLEGKPVDKIPNFNIVMLFAAKYYGVPYGKFCTDYKVMAEAQLKTAKDFGIDLVSTMSDAFRETYDYGAKIVFPEDDLPMRKSTLLHGPEDLCKLKRWDPMKSTRMLDRIQAVAYLKKAVGEEYPVLGWVEGAMAEFADLCDISEALAMLYEEPEFVKECLEIITEQAIDCALAQIQAGADIIGIGDACVSLIGSQLYQEFGQPYEKRIIDAVHQAGAKVKLHICGNITHLLEDIAEVGMDILDLDYMVDLEKAAQVTEGKCALCGNLNPMDVILDGGQKELEDSITEFLAKTNSCSIVSSGCEVPKMTPEHNLRVMDTFLKNM